MTKAYNDIDWQNIHAVTSFVETKDCWQQCDSYCCTTNHPDFSFRFIRPGQVQLPMCPQEYQYLKNAGKLQDDQPGAINQHSIEFAPKKQASVYMMRCGLGGLCRFPDFRPLICKIYPYLPIPTPSGDIEDLALGSVFDMARHAKDGYMPCPARRQDNHDMRAKAREAYKVLFDHPHLIFYFRVAGGILALMEHNLRQKFSEVLELPLQKYFKKWEVLYMTGQLTPGPEVAEVCRREYQAVAAVWGDFDTD
jgi:hypothetical protein